MKSTIKGGKVIKEIKEGLKVKFKKGLLKSRKREDLYTINEMLWIKRIDASNYWVKSEGKDRKKKMYNINRNCNICIKDGWYYIEE